MHVKKIKKPIGKTGYPVTSEYPAGYPNPDFQNPDIRVSGIKISIRYNPRNYFNETFEKTQKQERNGPNISSTQFFKLINIV